MQYKRLLGLRILARAIDIVLIAAIAVLTGSYLGFFVLFFVYNLLFCIFNSVTLGRLLTGLRINLTSFSIWRRIWREILYYLLFWVVFFELFFSEKPFVHERFSQASLIKI